jgi:hypothetical protein
MQPVVSKFSRLILDQGIVDEDKSSRLVLLKLCFEPLELLFAKRTNAGIEV